MLQLPDIQAFLETIDLKGKFASWFCGRYLT